MQLLTQRVPSCVQVVVTSQRTQHLVSRFFCMTTANIFSKLWDSEPHCPRCGKVVDAATPLGTASHPRPGDFSICAYCATLLRFTPTLTVEGVSEMEFLALPEEDRQQLQRMRIACALAALTRRPG